MATADATQSARLPPGPRAPKFVQSLGFLLAPARWINHNRRRYGDMVTFRSSFDPCFVMVLEPGLIREVFRAPPGRLNAGEANALLGPVVGERSVLLLDGAEHMRQRKLLLPPFHGARLRAHEEQILKVTDRTIDSWPVGERFSVVPTMDQLTLDVIAATIFGVEDGAPQDRLKAAIRAMLEPIGSITEIFLRMVTGGRRGAGRDEKFLALRRAVDEQVFAEIDRRRGVADLAERDDILSMLLQAQDEEGNPMTDAELRDELLTLLVAGHETTSNSIAWSLELLHRNPAALQRLRRSMDAGQTDYLDAVVKETLRLRSVISGVGRVPVDVPFELGGYAIPPGVQINPSIATVHGREDVYEDAGEFRPERFLGEDQPESYTWLPFGGGTRRCIGASFATMEMKLVIARILQRTALEPVGRRPERAVRRTIVFEPKRGVRMVQPAPPLPAPVPEPAAV